ncbi:hypothetical protein EVAR_7154_1 [Eumeta japonica]|uniref:Uncharacterized protein n=1 Tax=Eumeta variegata TaxID=151549 RepID=A0A4C1U6K7_EUMVA|nr:hypothetical protein EVAR_7154_1 [Eumeta japonica]
MSQLERVIRRARAVAWIYATRARASNGRRWRAAPLIKWARRRVSVSSFSLRSPAGAPPGPRRPSPGP